MGSMVWAVRAGQDLACDSRSAFQRTGGPARPTRVEGESNTSWLGHKAILARAVRQVRPCRGREDRQSDTGRRHQTQLEEARPFCWLAVGEYDVLDRKLAESDGLLRWYTGVFHHLRPQRCFRLDERRELLGSRRPGVDAELLEPALQFGHAQGLDDIRVEFRQYRLGHRCGRAQAVPNGDIESGYARLGNGRYFGQPRAALQRRDPQCP